MLSGVITCLVSVILLGIDGQFVEPSTYPKVSVEVLNVRTPDNDCSQVHMHNECNDESARERSKVLFSSFVNIEKSETFSSLERGGGW